MAGSTRGTAGPMAPSFLSRTTHEAARIDRSLDISREFRSFAPDGNPWHLSNNTPTMKATIPHKTLVEALDRIAGVSLSPSNRLATERPQLSNVMIEVKAESVILTANDLETSVSQMVRAESSTFGALSVPARALLAVVRSLPVADVAILRDNFRLEIEAGGVHFEVPGLDAADFPPVPSIETGCRTAVLEQSDLRRILALTEFAVSSDEKRPILNAVLVEFRPGQVTAVATDGRRLAIADAAAEGEATGQMILPSKTVATLMKACGSKGKARITFNDRRARFQIEQGISDSQPTPLGMIDITSALVAGTYPNTAQVIPSSPGQVVVVGRESLADAVSRSRLVDSKGLVGMLVTIGKGRMELVTKSIEGLAQEHVAVTGDGVKFKGRLNPAMLADPLGVVEQDEVALDVRAGAKQPVMLTSKGYRYLVMPMEDREPATAK
jgi:DNA polymerase-3 subunit beta